MKVPLTRAAVAFALVGAAVMLALCFSTALEGAGPYKALPGLSAWLAVGLGLTNLLILLLLGLAANRVSGLRSAIPRRATLLALTLFGAMAGLAAPLLPSAMLAGLCFRQSLCPDIANPLLWAYLRGFTSLPGAPLVVAPLVSLGMYVIAKRRSVDHRA